MDLLQATLRAAAVRVEAVPPVPDNNSKDKVCF